MQPVTEQISSFVLVMLLGLMIGIIFDIYRLLRWFYKPRKLGTVLGDAVFWVVVTSISYFFLLQSIWGEVRLYVFIALLLSIMIYMRFFSIWVRKGLYKLICFTISIFKKIVTIIIKPLRVLIGILLLPIQLITGFFLMVFHGLRETLILVEYSWGWVTKIFHKIKEELYSRCRK